MHPMSTLLVIDDEPAILFSIEQIFEGGDVQILTAPSAREGLRVMEEASPSVVVLDIRLGDASGLDLFQKLRNINPRVLVIFITGHGNADTAIEAMKLGAFDYLVKPLDLSQLTQVVQQAVSISRLMQVPAIIEESERPETRADRLVGSGPAMQAAFKQIGRIASQDVYVLILGESGTGKELVARAIYHHSHRRHATFLAINCAAIPEALLESELFGHEAGAFTGADRRRIGKFEQCHGGTLFLDEIGDMPLNTQAKILRVIQEGQFQRLGGSETLAANVRILAATNRDPAALIHEGRFRMDLYYRLRGVTIQLPALRERREDIPELAHYFLYRFNRELKTAIDAIAPEALLLLQRYHWPGNVRQLESTIREALIASAGSILLPDFLPQEVRLDQPGEAAVDTPTAEVSWEALASAFDAALASGQKGIYRQALAWFDRLLITRAMQQCDGQQTRAAELLGLSRVTLRAKLRALHLDVEHVVTQGPDPP
jgi:two-component system, NtrC family, nitrogen regulation response regulator GlnG